MNYTNKVTTDNSERWFVMLHYDMKHFMEQLKTENALRLQADRTIIESFYPHEFLSRQTDKLKSDLVNFVFLKASQSDIDKLLSEESNVAPRIRLKHYRNTDGTIATVPDKIMKEFLQACIKHRGEFEITPPISSIEATDKVRIISGPFTGYEALVTRVRLSHGAIHLNLALQLVSGVMNVQMCNVDKNKVTILNRENTDEIRTDFIEYTQNHLLDILEHRIKRVNDEAINRRDADMLTRLYRYRNYEIKNESARNHFQALMLICAHLCRYSSEEKVLTEQILASLSEMNRKSESKAATDTRTYLWIALYVSTHNPSYRDAAKEYVRDYQPKSAKLRRFVSLIRTGKKI